MKFLRTGGYWQLLTWVRLDSPFQTADRTKWPGLAVILRRPDSSGGTRPLLANEVYEIKSLGLFGRDPTHVFFDVNLVNAKDNGPGRAAGTDADVRAEFSLDPTAPDASGELRLRGK